MPEIIHQNTNLASIVMVIGVGGGGGNAVNHLYTYGNRDVSFMLCNTDKQALVNSPIPDQNKIQLGHGLGAGNDSQMGKKYAEESVDSIREVLISSDIKMAFVVAGMGGGTGTGASPIVAQVAKELGILTIGVVTIPFEEEGRHRIEQAIAGVDELSKNVDSLIIINNAHIVEMYGDLPMSKAYFQSNEIISKAVKSISDIINKHFIVNVDFADVCKVMRNSGVALMGTGHASGENRAIVATEEALTSPLLHNQDIKGATNVLVCMISSEKYELKMSDAYKVPKYIQERTKTKNETDIIWGAGYDNTLEDQMQVIVIATGFKVQNIPAMREYYSNTLGSIAEKNQDAQNNQKTNRLQLDSDSEFDTGSGNNKIQFENLESDGHQFYDEEFEDGPYQKVRGNAINIQDGEPYLVGTSLENTYIDEGSIDNTGKTIMLDDNQEEQNPDFSDPTESILDPDYKDDPAPRKSNGKKSSSSKPTVITSAIDKTKAFIDGIFLSKEDKEV